MNLLVSTIVSDRKMSFATEECGVYAYLDTGTKVMVRGGLSWDGAQKRWNWFDIKLRYFNQREIDLVVGDYIGSIRFFCVRSMSDPDWPSGQPNHTVETRYMRDSHSFTLP